MFDRNFSEPSMSTHSLNNYYCVGDSDAINQAAQQVVHEYNSLYKYELNVFQFSSKDVKVDLFSGRKDFYALCIILDGSSTWNFGGKALDLFVGDSVVLNPNDVFNLSCKKYCRAIIIKFYLDALSLDISDLGYYIPKAGIFFDQKKSSVRKSVALSVALLEILTDDCSELDLKNVSCLYKLLISFMLKNYSHNLFEFKVSQPVGDRYVEMIRQYVINNSEDVLSCDDIALLCGLSRKSVFNIFRKELGVTPMAYVRNIKLELVYKDLSERGKVKNITEVAISYGFLNVGRFSGYYRDFFGELPSETIRRSLYN
ncbi:helix-turn-helix domain-containing protein [Amphritea sp. HPY]|uniref:helix-turn-helix domain-containing protein n=1 Tax=Amphritea sp. HPY TaxID=3421652 RepID=UPI003D7EECEF